MTAPKAISRNSFLKNLCFHASIDVITALWMIPAVAVYLILFASVTSINFDLALIFKAVLVPFIFLINSYTRFTVYVKSSLHFSATRRDFFFTFLLSVPFSAILYSFALNLSFLLVNTLNAYPLVDLRIDAIVIPISMLVAALSSMLGISVLKFGKLFQFIFIVICGFGGASFGFMQAFTGNSRLSISILITNIFGLSVENFIILASLILFLVFSTIGYLFLRKAEV